MRSTVRARVKAGMLELLDNIDLPEYQLKAGHFYDSVT